ncbi:MAG: hypothetical protein JWM57_1034 [Phycisphaerales bacterium]|nr:hypothetical protein [Phycisphaerales bacterium]
MRSSRLIFLLCFALSIVVHAAIFETARHYAGGGGAVYHSSKKSKTAQPEPILLLPTPPPPKELFGDKNGGGNAINSSPGDEPQSAPLSRPDQAAMTRDPTGNGPMAAANPSPPKPLSQPLTPPPAIVPTPPLSRAPAFRKPPKPTPQPPKEAPPAEQPQPEHPQSPQQPPSPQTPPAPPTDATPAKVGGTPMPHSDRDSDPFAKEVSVEFKRGRVVARKGREIKFAKPRTNLSQMVEAAEIAFPARLQLKIAIDETGHVRRVDILRGTGSSSIDRAFLLAAYESWFEPAKDSQGRPIADDFEFTLSIE